MGGTKFDLCKLCYKKKCIFKKLSNITNSNDNNRDLYSKFYPVNSFLFRTNKKPQSLSVLCSGKVKLYQSTTNGNQLSEIIYPGEIINFCSIIDCDYQTLNAFALEDSMVMQMDCDIFSSYLKNNTGLYDHLIKNAFQRLDYYRKLSLTMSYAGAEERLLFVLNHLMEKKNRLLSTNKQPISLRRQDLADATGLAVETVVRNLKKLHEKKKISLNNKKIMINDSGLDDNK